MIDNLTFDKHTTDLVDFIADKSNFYITVDNKRQNIKTLKDLKYLNKQSSFAIRKYENDQTKGLLFVWKSNGEMMRNYIKIAYTTIQDVDDLLIVLNWKFNKEVYIKLPAGSEIINSFRRKGFKFCSGRGTEVLLRRDKNDRKFIAPVKEEDKDDEHSREY